MPSLNFVLPHWLYWGTLIVLPIVAIYMVARQRKRGTTERVSLFIAYLFWLTAGFMGVHRLYLRSLWGFAFLPFFLSVLYLNTDIRDAREDVSRTRAAVEFRTYHGQSRAAFTRRGSRSGGKRAFAAGGSRGVGGEGRV